MAESNARKTDDEDDGRRMKFASHAHQPSSRRSITALKHRPSSNSATPSSFSRHHPFTLLGSAILPPTFVQLLKARHDGNIHGSTAPCLTYTPATVEQLPGGYEIIETLHSHFNEAINTTVVSARLESGDLALKATPINTSLETVYADPEESPAMQEVKIMQRMRTPFPSDCNENRHIIRLGADLGIVKLSGVGGMADAGSRAAV